MITCWHPVSAVFLLGNRAGKNNYNKRVIHVQVKKGELTKVVSWEHVSLVGANRQMRDWDPIEIHTKDFHIQAKRPQEGI